MLAEALPVRRLAASTGRALRSRNQARSEWGLDFPTHALADSYVVLAESSAVLNRPSEVVEVMDQLRKG